MMFDTIVKRIDLCQYVSMSDLCCVAEGPIDEAEATRLANLLAVLADPVRLRIISMLATAPDGELCACDLPAALGRKQPTISHHLKQLVEAGLCEREQRGKWAWFRLRPERLAEVQAALGLPAAASPS